MCESWGNEADACQGMMPCRLQGAIDAASLSRPGSLSSLSLQDGSTPPPEATRALRPLTTAIEMVFGSAAALSATFGFRVCPLPIARLSCMHGTHT